MKLFVLFAVIASASCNVYPEIFEVDDDSTVSQASTACTVRLGQDTANPQPLFIRPGTSNWFHPASSAGSLLFTANQEIELFCTNGFATPAGVSGNSIRIACSAGIRFRFNNIFHNFNAFTCRDWPTFIARSTTARCFNNAVVVEVGFVVTSPSRFLRVYTSCHDTRTEVNYFTQYLLTPASDGQERSVERPAWSQGTFFPGKNVDIMHTRNNQRNTIATIVRSTPLAERYIEPLPSDVFLARGHMAAMTDFMTANEQRSTFMFVNTAPQWQTFNGLNWVSVEISSRRLAADRGITLETYTGTFGITRLRDVSNVWQQIFIDFPNRQIPVPQLYYKILVNRANNSGVVLLGVNNYHLTLAEILATYVICTDVSSRINYVTWQRTNLARGYGYACEVNDFLRRAPHIPGLSVANLLV